MLGQSTKAPAAGTAASCAIVSAQGQGEVSDNGCTPGPTRSSATA